MKNKIDESLLEVRQWKDKNFEDFKKSGFTSYLDYIREEMKKMNIDIIYEQKGDFVLVK